MRKVHISLVGGQPIPIYVGIKDDGQANTVVLVCSAQSEEETERIKMQFPKRDVIVEECPPTDLLSIECLAQKLKEQYSDYEITVNLTGGTKLWSLSFFRVFSTHPFTRFIYVDQTNQIVDLMTKETHRCGIDINTRFELYGTPLKDFCSIEEYTPADFEVMKEVERIRRVNKKAFSIMTNDMSKEKLEEENPITDYESGSSIVYTNLPKWAKITLHGSKGSVTKELECEHLFDILFNAGWFELKTARDLKRFFDQSEDIVVRDIKLNGTFADSDGLAKNEIDIIVDFGYRLLFVECKTMIRTPTDIDKFRSALRNFSGTSSSGLFVTYEKPNDNTRMNYQLAMEKCKDNNIQTFNYSLWNEDREHLPSLGMIVKGMLQQQNKR